MDELRDHMQRIKNTRKTGIGHTVACAMLKELQRLVKQVKLQVGNSDVRSDAEETLLNNAARQQEALEKLIDIYDDNDDSTTDSIIGLMDNHSPFANSQPSHVENRSLTTPSQRRVAPFRGGWATFSDFQMYCKPVPIGGETENLPVPPATEMDKISSGQLSAMIEQHASDGPKNQVGLFNATSPHLSGASVVHGQMDDAQKEFSPSELQKLLDSNKFTTSDHVSVENVENAFASQKFHSLDMHYSKELLYYMSHHFKFTSFRPGQLSAINGLMTGQDAFIQNGTSSGKSFIYQMLACLLHGVVVVIEPVIIIIEQQCSYLDEIGIVARKLVGYDNGETHQAILDEILEKNSPVKILYISPEYLRKDPKLDTFWEKMKGTKSQLPLGACLVVDEAHAAVKWSLSFRPVYLYLRILRSKFPSVPIVAFTATATAALRRLIFNEWQIKEPLVFLGNVDRPNIKLTIVRKRLDWEDQIVELLDGKLSGRCELIYCYETKECDNLAEFLRDKGFTVATYHSAMDKRDKKESGNMWLDGVYRILVGTTSMIMGTDNRNAEFFVHTYSPQSIDDYDQGFGRIGRDGQAAYSYVLYDPKDVLVLQSRIVNHAMQLDVKKCNLRDLQSFEVFCNTFDKCRRRLIVENYEQICKQDLCDVNSETCCDNCSQRLQYVTVDVTHIADAILQLLKLIDRQHLVWDLCDVFLVLTGQYNLQLTYLPREILTPFHGYCKGMTEPYFEAISAKMKKDETIESRLAASKNRQFMKYNATSKPFRIVYPAGLQVVMPNEVLASFEGPNQSIDERRKTLKRPTSNKRGSDRQESAAKRFCRDVSH